MGWRSHLSQQVRFNMYSPNKCLQKSMHTHVHGRATCGRGSRRPPPSWRGRMPRNTTQQLEATLWQFRPGSILLIIPRPCVSARRWASICQPCVLLPVDFLCLWEPICHHTWLPPLPRAALDQWQAGAGVQRPHPFSSREVLSVTHLSQLPRAVKPQVPPGTAGFIAPS